MSNRSPESLMLSIFALVNDINLVGLRLNFSRTEVLGKVSLPVASLTPYEFGFLRGVSWFYVLYYETGKVNVEFLLEQLTAYEIGHNENRKSHLTIVHQMRTYLQHNLDPTKEQNRMIQYACEHWLREQCKGQLPTMERDWRLCLLSLLQDALDFLTALKDCIRLIEQDESRENILQQWRICRERYHPPYEYDRLISIVAADMGREKINAVRLRSRYYDKWTKELELQQGSYDFEVEGRKLIEHVLLTETTPILPITGKDIIDEFNVPSGPKVGELLRLAYKLYMDEPCSREHLLAKLRMDQT